MDNNHVHIYRALQPSLEQRARMTEVWLAWESRKRQHDTHMNEARALLRALLRAPPLPHIPLILISLACERPAGATVCPAARSSPPTPFYQFPQVCGPTAAVTSSLVKNVEGSFMKACVLPSHPLQSYFGNFGHVSPYQQPSSAATVLASKPMHMQPDNRSVLDLSVEGDVRSLGQHAASTEAAGRAMHGLSVLFAWLAMHTCVCLSYSVLCAKRQVPVHKWPARQYACRH